MTDLDWTKVDIALLPPQFREIANDVGIEVAQYLVETWGGSLIYVPSLTRITSIYVSQQINIQFTGSNEMELARRFGISRSAVRKVLRDSKK